MSSVQKDATMPWEFPDPHACLCSFHMIKLMMQIERKM